MLTAAKGLSRIRPYYDEDTRYLFRVMLTAISTGEACIAVDLLSKTVPEKVLVATLNMREAFKAVPATPFRMAVDERTFVRVGSMYRDRTMLVRETYDGYEVGVTTSGNLVLDLIVKYGDDKYFWTPIPRTENLVDGELVEHLIESEYLFETVVEVVKAMGVVFNPVLHLSLADWRLEHESETIPLCDGLPSL